MKYIFIINKIAGRGRYIKILPNIESACKKRSIDYEIRYVEENYTTAQIAEEYKDTENIIYVVGGDGTITTTLKSIVGTNNKLGIIPAGSGNDTYRTIKKLPKGESVIDLGKINDTYFINVACTGVDAEVANNVDILRKTKIPTSQLYNASIVYTFVKFKPKKVKLKSIVKNYLAVVLKVANSLPFFLTTNFLPLFSMLNEKSDENTESCPLFQFHIAAVEYLSISLATPLVFDQSI